MRRSQGQRPLPPPLGPPNKAYQPLSLLGCLNLGIETYVHGHAQCMYKRSLSLLGGLKLGIETVHAQWHHEHGEGAKCRL